MHSTRALRAVGRLPLKSNRLDALGILEYLAALENPSTVLLSKDWAWS